VLWPVVEVTLWPFELSDVDAMMVWASVPLSWDAYESTEPLLAYRPTEHPLYIPRRNPSDCRPCRPLKPLAGPIGLCHAPLCAEPVLVAGPVSFKEADPLLLLFLF
jgi:hypothetical protein